MALSEILQTNLQLEKGDCTNIEAPPDNYGQPVIKPSTRVEIELLDDPSSGSISVKYAQSFFNNNRLLCVGSVFVSEPAGALLCVFESSTWATGTTVLRDPERRF